jgi:hypothetical protein
MGVADIRIVLGLNLLLAKTLGMWILFIGIAGNPRRYAESRLRQQRGDVGSNEHLYRKYDSL